MPVKNSYCSYSGHPFAANQPWPRRCAACGETTFLNPIPVAVELAFPFHTEAVRAYFAGR